MQALLLFVYTPIAIVASTAYGAFQHNGSLHIGLLDEDCTEHHLIAIRKIVAVTLIQRRWENTLGSVFHWTASRWFYDEETQKIVPFKDRDLCLEADPESFTLHLSNCSSSKPQNQRFAYDQKEKELFWIDQNEQQHPIYLEKDCTRLSRGPFTQRRPFVSKNPLTKWVADEARRFVHFPSKNASKLITSIPRVSRLRALTLHSLQRSLPNMTSIEYQKYMEMIASLNEREFGYFVNKQNRYLLSDGHTVTPSKKDKGNDTNYKYYGLWNLNENNHLVHFLSGKYLQAIPNWASSNIKLLENRLLVKANLTKMNDTFYDLKVNEYTEDYRDTFVTVDEKGEQHEMYVHHDGVPNKIGGTIMTQGGTDAFLAFTSEATHDEIWRIIMKDIAEKNKKGGQKVKVKVRMKISK